jgi:hypothetical protein
MGVNVTDTTPEIKMAAQMVIKIRGTAAPARRQEQHRMNTAASDRVIDTMVKPISSIRSGRRS